MRDLRKTARRLLADTELKKVEITATPPFVKLVFERQEFEGILQCQDAIADLISRYFIGHQVFWLDLEKEEIERTKTSLLRAKDSLMTEARSLGSKPDPAMVGLARIVRSWAQATDAAYANLQHKLEDIAAEKASVLGYDSANEDRRHAMKETLIELRQTVYPSVQVLTSFLSDDDPTKAKSQQLIDSGLEHLESARLVRDIMPDLDEAS